MLLSLVRPQQFLPSKSEHHKTVTQFAGGHADFSAGLSLGLCRLCWSKARFCSWAQGFTCVFRFFLWCYKQHSSCVTCHTSYSHFGFVMGKILSLPCFLCLKQRGLECAVVSHTHPCCICSQLLPHNFERGEWRERPRLHGGVSQKV